MTKYSCRFLDTAHRIDDVEVFECDTDSLAQERAIGLFARRNYPELELWRIDRSNAANDELVFTHERGA